MKSLDRLEGTVGGVLQEMGNLREENRRLRQEIQKLKGIAPLRKGEAFTKLKAVIEKLDSFSITKS